MKTWKNAEVVELNINETAHGKADAYVEFSIGGWGTNNDLADGKDSDGDGKSGTIFDNSSSNSNNNTPDTLS